MLAYAVTSRSLRIQFVSGICGSTGDNMRKFFGAAALIVAFPALAQNAPSTPAQPASTPGNTVLTVKPKPKLICTTQTVTGSLVQTKRTCVTPKEAADARADAQRTYRDMTGVATPCGATQCP